MLYPTPIAKLIDSYSKLPGIGIKTATRLAFYTIGMSDDDVNEFAKNLLKSLFQDKIQDHQSYLD